MKQFRIGHLFAVVTIVAVMCGVFYWFGPNSPAPFLVCLVVGPLVGSVVRISWQDSVDFLTKSVRGGAYGGGAGYLAGCFLLACEFFYVFSGAIGVSRVGELSQIICLIASAGFVGLVISFAYGGMVGVVIAAGWAIVKWMIAVAAPKNQQVE